MLHVVKAQTAHLAAEAVVSMIKGEGRHVVIAPDPFTLAVESKTLKSDKKCIYFAFFLKKNLHISRNSVTFAAEK